MFLQKAQLRWVTRFYMRPWYILTKRIDSISTNLSGHNIVENMSIFCCGNVQTVPASPVNSFITEVPIIWNNFIGFLCKLFDWVLYDGDLRHERFHQYHQQVSLQKKWSFPLRFSSVNVTKPQFPAYLVTFTEEILNGKFNFLCILD